MKKRTIAAISLLFLLVATCSTILFTESVALAATNDLTDYISNREIITNTPDFEIYGNQIHLTEQDFQSIIYNGDNKIYLHYRTDRDIPISYDALLCIKTTEKVYSFQFNENEQVDTNTLIVEIKSFIELYKNRIAEIKTNKYKTQTISNEVPQTFVNCAIDKEYVVRFEKFGYAVYRIGVSKYSAGDNSQLYIASIRTSFVPGSVANTNGDSSFYNNSRNKSGYVHMTVEQAYDSNEKDTYGIRYGGLTYKKDYWPLNEPGVVSISSSVQAGLNFGYSFTNGFSKDGLSISQNVNLGLNVSYSYSKTITTTNPALTVQSSFPNTDAIQWSYSYAESRGSEETYHLQTFYMFELSNLRNSMRIGDFRLKINIMFGSRRLSITRQHKHSADLFVGADARRVIYPFDNGKI